MDSRKKNFQLLSDICYEVRGIRILGSGELHLARISVGQLDFYFKFKPNYWDCAAGIVLIEEAGGKVTDLDGNPITRSSKIVVASNGKAHDKILELLKSKC